MSRVSYAIRVLEEPREGPAKRSYFQVTFDSQELADLHPIDIFGEIFRRSLMEAAKQMAEHPQVREVPIYEAGRMEPVAYLTRRKSTP